MKIFLVLAAVILWGCVQARDPQLVPMKQGGDSGLTCEQVSLEYKTNTEVAQSKIAKNRSDDRRELLLGILVWPGLFDLKNADGNEGQCLAGSQYLPAGTCQKQILPRHGRLARAASALYDD